MQQSPRLTRAAARGLPFAILLATAGCQRGDDAEAAGSASASALAAGAASDTAQPLGTADQGKNSVAAVMPTDKPLLGITSFVAIVYKEPRDTAKRVGYLRVGAKVPRSAEAVSTKGCKEGWYEISPFGFVCGADGTTDLEHPVLRAATKGPDLAAAMPYRYGFVRAVLPLYLEIPTAAEQHKSEFKLKDHLAWYEENKADVDKVRLGAFDVALDERGVPLKGKMLGELGQNKNSLEVGLGVHFGGQTDSDPPPWWLEGGTRHIPNISDFAVPDTAIFADRARRFTGLGLIASFQTGEGSLNRRFAVTTDLRLAPTTKLKPDTGSPWHGVEIEDPADLPFAFVTKEGAVSYSIDGDGSVAGEDLSHRSVVKLTGKQKRVGDAKYYAKRDGGWVRADDVGLVVAPRTFPKIAESGQKWIEVSLSQQVLTMWEGKDPIYATLVSTGRKEYPTITGEFRIRNKHITATMDSNEQSDVGGSATRQTAQKSDPAPGRTKTAKADSKPKEKPAAKKDAEAAPADPAKIPRRGDGEYGVTKRRGEGTYQLRDVPYIQYFAQGYALHGAYWHDVFGKKRSHGCINLSPIDAHRVFQWTEPAIPQGWHAINTSDGSADADKGEFGEGTTVVVHE
jgi:lipoprotein-anchoring transpeptidase ErfK/SrfK